MINSSTKDGNERRYFPRVDYRAYATLSTPERNWPVHILDLSFNGALIALIHKHTLNDGQHVVLNIETDDGSIIKMQGHLSHQKEHFLGVEGRATGIDNQARLRELLEKNKSTGVDWAERSYASLVNDHEIEMEK
ncbi:MAG: PilZ domain-containing protein [Cellvibrionaceae bacterium]